MNRFPCIYHKSDPEFADGVLVCRGQYLETSVMSDGQKFNVHVNMPHLVIETGTKDKYVSVHNIRTSPGVEAVIVAANDIMSHSKKESKITEFFIESFRDSVERFGDDLPGNHGMSVRFVMTQKNTDTDSRTVVDIAFAMWNLY